MCKTSAIPVCVGNGIIFLASSVVKGVNYQWLPLMYINVYIVYHNVYRLCIIMYKSVLQSLVIGISQLGGPLQV